MRRAALEVDRTILKNVVIRVKILVALLVPIAFPPRVVAARATGSEQAAYRYFYEDIFKPFFRFDGNSLEYHTIRAGSTPQSIAAKKETGTFRVFIVGGSIAQMYYGPEDLSATLSRAARGRRVEVVNCGMAGYDARREELVVDEVLGLSPDAIVLMSGHNESARHPWIPRWRAVLFGFLARAGLASKTLSSNPGAVAATTTEKFADFRETVARMGRKTAARGATFVVVLPPLNVKDGPTFDTLPPLPEFRRGWGRALLGDCRGAMREWKGGGGSRREKSLYAFFYGRCADKMESAREADAAYESALKLDEPLTGRCGPECREMLLRGAVEGGALVADVDATFRSLAAPRLPGMDFFSDRVHWRRDAHGIVSATIVEALRSGPQGGGLDAPPSPHRPKARSSEEWLEAARYAGAAITALDSRGVVAPSFAALQRLVAERPATFSDLDAGVRLLERVDSGMGAAWGMAPLAIPLGLMAWQLGAIELWEGRVARADVFFERAVKEGVNDADFLMDRAVLLHRRGNKTEARAQLALAAKLDLSPRSVIQLEAIRQVVAPGIPAFITERWMALPGEKPDPVRARAEARLHERSAASSEEEALRIGRLYVQAGDHEDARRVLCEVFAPVSAQGLSECAKASVAVGRVNEGLASAMAALARNPDALVRHEVALTLQAGGRIDLAMNELRSLVRKSPDDLGLVRDLGTVLYLSGDRDEALPLLLRAAKNPDDASAAVSAATALRAANRGDEALAILRAARRRARGGWLSILDAELSR